MKNSVKSYQIMMMLAMPANIFALASTDNTHFADIKELSVRKQGDSLSISFSIVTDNVELQSNKSVKFIPMLVNGDSTCTLKTVTVAGQRQYISSQRRKDYDMLVHGKNGKPLNAYYHTTIEYKKWMNTAQLMMAQNRCGCGGDPFSEDNTLLRTLKLEVPVFYPKPIVAFAVPHVEAVKHRQESGSAFLDFPVNQTVIYPQYRRNSVELDKISATIDVVRNDTNTYITGILIHGYASPEGSFDNNRRLAQGRAHALKQYVKQKYGFADSIFRVRSTPEDWEGLKKYVLKSSLQQRDKLMDIINGNSKEDEKNRMIENLDGGKTYRFLLDNVYPALRHSDYTVDYTVKPFDVEMAKRILKTRPQLLSLNEMFMVAKTCEPESEDFKKVFEIAVNLFPEDTTANLNAANIALSEGNWQRAERYLTKAGNSPQAILASGICAMLKGDYTLAKDLLMKASMEGLQEAELNLEQLELKLENIKDIECNKF